MGSFSPRHAQSSGSEKSSVTLQLLGSGLSNWLAHTDSSRTTNVPKDSVVPETTSASVSTVDFNSTNVCCSRSNRKTETSDSSATFEASYSSVTVADSTSVRASMRTMPEALAPVTAELFSDGSSFFSTSTDYAALP